MLQVATEMLIRMEDEEDQAVEEGHRPEATGRREEQQQKHKQKQKQKQKRSKAMDHRPQGEEQEQKGLQLDYVDYMDWVDKFL